MRFIPTAQPILLSVQFSKVAPACLPHQTSLHMAVCRPSHPLSLSFPPWGLQIMSRAINITLPRPAVGRPLASLRHRFLSFLFLPGSHIFTLPPPSTIGAHDASAKLCKEKATEGRLPGSPHNRAAFSADAAHTLCRSANSFIYSGPFWVLCQGSKYTCLFH